MEKYDSRMAHRVWSRVWAEPEQPLQGPGHLMLCEAQAFADYTKLQKQFPEMKALSADIRHHIACLRGIRYLKDGQRPEPIAVKPREEAVDTTLRRCYAQSLKAAADYTSQAEDEEYGCIFAQLADAKRRHCRILLEILGRTDKPNPHK